jgi:copper chaperone CopZ
MEKDIKTVTLKFNTMKLLSIAIPDMQSAHCQKRVSQALSNMEAVLIKDIQAGRVDISVEGKSNVQMIKDTIEKAGYNVGKVTVVNDEAETKFKTNINCNGCVAAVTPTLNALVGEDSWQVDTTDPNKILTITNSKISSTEIKEAIKDAGFIVENMA